MSTVFDTRRTGRWLASTLLLPVCLATAACDDDDDLDVVRVVPPARVTSTVVTVHDTTFDFTALRTFAMPDTVVHLAPRTGTPIPVSRQFDRAILDQVRQNFLARGYTLAPDPQHVAPDFVVVVGATAEQDYLAWLGYSWYSAWGFYSGWGWYAPGFTIGWGVIYPWYPVAGVTTFETGTLLVDLIPTRSVNPLTQTIGSAWAGAARALLNGTLTTSDVTAAIDLMFAQSPYLVAGAP